MTIDPQQFFIGVIDFFSILLPGALVTFLLQDEAGPLILGSDFETLSGVQGWLAFLVSSYLLGHFTFLLGSVLDEHVYDRVRRATAAQQDDRVARGKKPASRLTKWVAQRLIKDVSDLAVDQAVRIKERHMDRIDASDAINAFQWCKARLTIEHPEGAVRVERFEADSKFFRSLVVVMLLVVPWSLLAGRNLLAVLGVVLMVLAFCRYVDQRVKSINQAYWYVLTLEASQARNAC